MDIFYLDANMRDKKELQKQILEEPYRHLSPEERRFPLTFMTRHAHQTTIHRFEELII